MADVPTSRVPLLSCHVTCMQLHGRLGSVLVIVPCISPTPWALHHADPGLLVEWMYIGESLAVYVVRHMLPDTEPPGMAQVTFFWGVFLFWYL